MKIALVHDWLIDFGGAEKVLEELLCVFPEADVFTLIHDKGNEDFKFLKDKNVFTSHINKIPLINRFYRSLLPIFPFFIEQFDLSNYDLIISSSHTVAKGVITPVESQHVCYCHSPARYCWDLYAQYMSDGRIGFGPIGLIKRILLHRFRAWDVVSSTRVDHFVSNSEYIAKRIMKFYKRSSHVIYPPVDIERFYASEISQRGDYFVVCSRLVPYKKVDLIAKTFTKHFPSFTLKIIGSGPEMERIKKVSGANIELLGHIPDSLVSETLSQARAFVYAAHEDFGISIIEALASGLPVIAYGKGASKEILEIDGSLRSAIVFDDQNESSLKKAIEEFIVFEDQFPTENCLKNSQDFSKQKFREKFDELVNRLM